MNTDTTNRFSWKTAILLSLASGLLIAGLSIFLQTRGLTVEALSSALPSPAIAAPAAPGTASSFTAPGKPVRLIIPSIGVDAHIQSVGLYWKGDGTMGIPTNFTDVAWYNGGPRPGEPGSAVIDGHLDGRNVKEAVFYNLGELKQGDAVEVVDDAGKTLHFEVVAIKTYAVDAPTTDIFSSDPSEARLNLITCAGDWDKSLKSYNERTVVFTKLITAE
jgi:LPXTG-site transpeptidase (sortase) family protein